MNHLMPIPKLMTTPNLMTHNLSDQSEIIREHLETQHSLREQAISQTRALNRLCANCIRAIHRREWVEAEKMLAEAAQSVATIQTLLADHLGLYHSGHVQDTLKEYAEAALTYALIRDEALPSPSDLALTPTVYVNGLAEASTELRRQILDIIRHEEGHSEAERMLDLMDAIYALLITLDFPEAVTDGLRRRTDVLRGVLERTRSDLTLSIRQQNLQAALQNLTARLGLEDVKD